MLLAAVSNRHHTKSETMSAIPAAIPAIVPANIANIPQLIELARASRTKEERQDIMHQIHHARAFEALVVKHGSVAAAQSYLAAESATRSATRERELASMGARGQICGGRSE